MSEIKISGLSFAYPEAAGNTLENLDMCFEQGTLNVVCGKSGCGKSTLLRHLKTTLRPHGNLSGAVLYNDVPLDQVDEKTQSAEIGFVLQNPENQIVTDKVWHELAFGLESLGVDEETIRLRVAEMSSYFGIHAWIRKDAASLSGGQKQLLNLAGVMAMHPQVLVLDEPTSMLDPIAASDFLGTVKKINRDLGTTVILTEHRLEDILPYADRVFVLDKGQLIAEGTPLQIAERLRALHHDMFLAMPAPMRIWSETDSRENCPLTIAEGRRWLSGIKNRTPGMGKPVPLPEKTQAAKAENGTPALEVSGLWFRYEREGQDVVRGLDMTVREGEFYAVVGGNGTGKSTMLSLLCRVRQPYRGKIKVFGRDIRSYTDRELYRGVLGVLPQSPQNTFLKNTMREDLFSVIGGSSPKKTEDYTAAMPKQQAVEGMVRLCGLEGLLDRHPYDLSGGEQQKLALAKVLLLRPRVLLMDEPTKGMDAGFKQEFGDILKKLQQHGITIFLISHDIEFVAEYADRTAFFFEGSIATCQPTRDFFKSNSFYTTAANRMARHIFPDAVTAGEVVTCLRTSTAL